MYWKTEKSLTAQNKFSAFRSFQSFFCFQKSNILQMIVSTVKPAVCFFQSGLFQNWKQTISDLCKKKKFKQSHTTQVKNKNVQNKNPPRGKRN